MHIFTADTPAGGFTFDPLTLVMLAVLVVMVIFMFRNSRKRKAAAAEQATKLVPGAQVMTNFGLFGELREIDEESNEAYLEIAPGTVVRVHRQAVTRVVEPDAPVADGSHEAIDETPDQEPGDTPDAR